jgi:acyl dehydratase
MTAASGLPRANLFLDDLTVGDRFESKGMTLTEADIVDFARQWDPQPFHIDSEAAGRSHFGGLIASGFQTLAVAFRMFYQTGVIVDANMGGPGVDELRWLLPVRPGDTLRVAAEVKEIVPSRSKPDRGLLKLGLAASNQRGDVVMTATLLVMMRRQQDGAPSY